MTATRERDKKLPFAHVHLTLEEYSMPSLLGGEKFSREELVRVLLIQFPRELLVSELAVISRVAATAELRAELIAEYPQALPEDSAELFRAALVKDRILINRQALLRAMRLVLLEGTDDPKPDGRWRLSSMFSALALVHAMADDLGKVNTGAAGPELFPGVAEQLAMDLIQNYAFHAQEEIWSLLARYGTLWEDYSSAADRAKLPASPDELFRSATGVDRRDLFAFGFGLWSMTDSWKRGESYQFDLKDRMKLDPEIVEKCVGLVAADWDELIAKLKDQTGDWQVLPFQEQPVLRLKTGRLVVLDRGYLLERISSGLYWYVFAGENPKGKEHGDRWSTAYGAMLEAYAEDRIKAMAPKPPDFYTEEQIRQAYGGRQCDAALDLAEWLFFEVQKAPLSLPAKQEGRVDKFRLDTDNIVLHKVDQTQQAALQVLDDEEPLTGRAQRSDPRGRPIIVSAGSYPLNPITNAYIEHQVIDRKLLVDPRFSKLCVIDLGELDMLEATYEKSNQPPAHVLDEWKTGGWRNYSLRAHLGDLSNGDPDQYRTKRIIQRGEEILDEVGARIEG